MQYLQLDSNIMLFYFIKIFFSFLWHMHVWVYVHTYAIKNLETSELEWKEASNCDAAPLNKFYYLRKHF